MTPNPQSVCKHYCGHCGQPKDNEAGLCSACGKFPTKFSPTVAEPASLNAPAGTNPFLKGYTHRHGEPVSDACGEGKHSECTEDLTKCHCTFRGGHSVMHAYMNPPMTKVAPAGTEQAKALFGKLGETAPAEHQGVQPVLGTAASRYLRYCDEVLKQPCGTVPITTPQPVAGEGPTQKDIDNMRDGGKFDVLKTELAEVTPKLEAIATKLANGLTAWRTGQGFEECIGTHDLFEDLVLAGVSERADEGWRINVDPADGDRVLQWTWKNAGGGLMAQDVAVLVKEWNTPEENEAAEKRLLETLATASRLQSELEEAQRLVRVAENAFQLQDAFSVEGRAGELNGLQIAKAWLALEKRAETAEARLAAQPDVRELAQAWNDLVRFEEIVDSHDHQEFESCEVCGERGQYRIAKSRYEDEAVRYVDHLMRMAIPSAHLAPQAGVPNKIGECGEAAQMGAKQAGASPAERPTKNSDGAEQPRQTVANGLTLPPLSNEHSPIPSASHTPRCPKCGSGKVHIFFNFSDKGKSVLLCRDCRHEEWTATPAQFLPVTSSQGERRPAYPKRSRRARLQGTDLARWIWCRFVGIPIVEPYDKEFRLLLLKIASYTDELKQCESLERMATIAPAPHCPVCGSYKLQCRDGHSWDIPATPSSTGEATE